MWARRAIAGATVVALLVLHGEIGPTWAKAGRQFIDVKVAIRAANHCGTFADQAPALVTVANALRGTTSTPVALCLQNAGTVAGRLTMTSTGRLDVETGCTGDESQVDATCGAGAGELSPSVQHFVARDRNCVGSVKDPVVAGFTALERTPILLYDTVGPGQTFCVVTWVRYSPSTIASEVAAQTDRVTWRYSFHLDAP